MDLAEKLKHLEALREARRAKQKLVEQFAASRAEATPYSSVVGSSELPTQSAGASLRDRAPFCLSSGGNAAFDPVRSSTNVGEAVAGSRCVLSLVSNQGCVSVGGAEQTGIREGTNPANVASATLLTQPGSNVRWTISEAAWHHMLQYQGYQIFSASNIVGHAQQSVSLTSIATARCVLTPCVLGFTSKRLVTDVATCSLPYRGFATDSSASSAPCSDFRVPCVVASYATEVRTEPDMLQQTLARPSSASEVFADAEGQPSASVPTAKGVVHEAASVFTPGESGILYASDEECMAFRSELNTSFAWGLPSSIARLTPGSMLCKPRTPSATALEAAAGEKGGDDGVSMLSRLRAAPGLVLAMITIPLPACAPRPGLSGCTTRDAPSDTAASPAEGGPSSSVSSVHTLVIVLPLLCDAEVCTLLAHPYQPQLLLGGTRSGQLVSWLLTPPNAASAAAASSAQEACWDSMSPPALLARAVSSTGGTSTLLLPPQRPLYASFPSPTAHQGPILRLAVLGDATAHLLYSVSEEGRVCTWPAWQALRPTAVRSAYLGSHPLGRVGTSASFVCVPGTDAMTQVLLGDATGQLLCGTPREAQLLEVRPYQTHRSNHSTHPTLPRSTARSSYGSGDVTDWSTLPTASTRGGAVMCVAVQPQSITKAGALAYLASRPVETSAACVLTVTQGGECMLFRGELTTVVRGTSQARCAAWCPAVPCVFALGDTRGQVSLYDTRASLRAPVTVLRLRAGRWAEGCDAAPTRAVTTAASATETCSSVPTMGTANGVAYSSSEVTNTVLLRLQHGRATSPDSLPAHDATSGANITAAVTCMRFSKDGQWLCVGVASGNVYMVELGLRQL